MSNKIHSAPCNLAKKHRANGSVPFARRDEARASGRIQHIEYVTTEGKMTKKRSSGAASHPAPVSEATVRAGEFNEVLALIEVARRRAYQAVNVELVGLYWQLGEYISRKIESAQWGDRVVNDLAAAIARRYPGLRGYTRRNLFRMRQFYVTYRSNEKVSPLVTQLPWTHHLILLSQTKHIEEREFYMLAAIQQHWTKRELERQIRSGAALAHSLAARKCHRR